jgi:hypothetical protein
MDSPPPEEEYRGGFAGPTGNRVDFTPVTEGSANEEEALRTHLEEYLSQEDAMTPPGNAVPVEVIGAFVKFHERNEIWGSFSGKSFVKEELIGECPEAIHLALTVNSYRCRTSLRSSLRFLLVHH